VLVGIAIISRIFGLINPAYQQHAVWKKYRGACFWTDLNRQPTLRTYGEDDAHEEGVLAIAITAA